MSSIFIFCHFTGKIEGKIEDGEIRGLKQMDTMGKKEGSTPHYRNRATLFPHLRDAADSGNRDKRHPEHTGSID